MVRSEVLWNLISHPRQNHLRTFIRWKKHIFRWYDRHSAKQTPWGQQVKSAVMAVRTPQFGWECGGEGGEESWLKQHRLSMWNQSWGVSNLWRDMRWGRWFQNSELSSRESDWKHVRCSVQEFSNADWLTEWEILMETFGAAAAFVVDSFKIDLRRSDISFFCRAPFISLTLYLPPLHCRLAVLQFVRFYSAQMSGEVSSKKRATENETKQKSRKKNRTVDILPAGWLRLSVWLQLNRWKETLQARNDVAAATAVAARAATATTTTTTATTSTAVFRFVTRTEKLVDGELYEIMGRRCRRWRWRRRRRSSKLLSADD